MKILNLDIAKNDNLISSVEMLKIISPELVTACGGALTAPLFKQAQMSAEVLKELKNNLLEETLEVIEEHDHILVYNSSLFKNDEELLVIKRHELGHISLDHIRKNGSKINEMGFLIDLQVELEADAWAVEGHPELILPFINFLKRKMEENIAFLTEEGKQHLEARIKALEDKL